MVASITRQGVVLAGILASASMGCLRFGAPVVGSERDRDATASDVADERDAAVSIDLGPDSPDAPDAPDAIAPADVPTAADAVVRCAQNDDCIDPARALCEVSTGRCVGCLTAPDTCPLGRFCAAATQACQDGCREDRDCLDGGTCAAGACR